MRLQQTDRVDQKLYNHLNTSFLRLTDMGEISITVSKNVNCINLVPVLQLTCKLLKYCTLKRFRQYIS